MTRLRASQLCPPPRPSRWFSWRSIAEVQSIFPIAALGLGAYVCYRLAAPFLSPLAWALALTILLLPMHRWLHGKLGRSSLAAAITVAVAALLIVAPTAYVSQRLVTESIEGAELVRNKIESGALGNMLSAHTSLTSVVKFFQNKVDINGALQTASRWLSGAAALLVKSSIIEIIRVVLTFYFLFYFLRDHRQALATIKSLAPMRGEEVDRLFREIADTVHATIYGTLVVAAVQGALGGFMFWLLGLPAPIFWGFVMGLLAIAPVLGAFVVWIPAAVSLALDGNWDKALALTFWGAIVVGGIDNWLYPILVGRRMKLHTVLAFIATIGGLILFGPSGLILGPVALTITLFLLHASRPEASPTETKPEPQSQSPMA